MKRIAWLVVALFALALVAWAQDKEKVIKHVPLKQTSPASGEEMYKNYCASCHGADLKGNGPAASALKVPPNDLTLMAKNAGGKYPSAKVVSAIKGDIDLPAHGSKDMPVWGPLFWRLSAGRAAEVQQRIANINSYIESKQAK
jgi:mono/diheme cytochrome c family protein